MTAENKQAATACSIFIYISSIRIYLGRRKIEETNLFKKIAPFVFNCAVCADGLNFLADANRKIGFDELSKLFAWDA